MHLQRILLLVLLVAPGARAQTGTLRQAIVNGTRDPQLVTLDPAQQRAIGFLAAPREPTTAFCTGTLIDVRTVVTAEHCVTYRDPERLLFGTGHPEDETTHPVEAVFRHPDLDIALLRLAEAPADTTPLAWQSGDLPGAIGDDVEAAGYGDLGNGTQDGLFFVVLPIVAIESQVIDVDGAGSRGICQGDSGGPIMMMIDAVPTVLAVESTGDPNCVGRDRLIRTAGVEAWIRQGVAGELTVEETPDGCVGLDFLGRCSGSVAEWCDPDGILAARDCALDGQDCAYIDDELGYFCAERTTLDCAVANSICSNTSVRSYCINGQPRAEDCLSKGLSCAITETGAWCVDADGRIVAPDPVPDGCCRIGRGGTNGGWWLALGLLGWRARRRRAQVEPGARRVGR